MAQESQCLKVRVTFECVATARSVVASTASRPSRTTIRRTFVNVSMAFPTMKELVPIHRGNTALGALGDTVEDIQRVINYLKGEIHA